MGSSKRDNIVIYISAIILLFVALAARAGEPAKPVTIHGFVDGYYAWNGNSPASHDSFFPGAGSTGKRANEFNLNLAALEIVRDAAPLGFHLSLVAGNGADVIHAAESEGLRHIYQASVIYKLNDKLTIEGGIFPSHIGFESFYSKDDWNYTRSWPGELSPFYQTGVHASYRFDSHWSGEVHVLNGWQIINDNNDAKAIGGKIAYTNDRLTTSFNTFDGPELQHDNSHWRHFGDLIASYKVTPKLSIAGSVDRGHQELPGDATANWLGIAAFGRYAFDGRHAVAARGSLFNDPDNAISGAAQKLTEETLTYEFHPVANLIMKIEGRHDHSTAAVFARKNGFTNNQTIIVAGAVATF
ncbi:MAG TPA: outer membrane beta-barrel protein [Thermoanaerobaculia bacterium]|jgi:hypothetical protein|nr:outer membrane beta-barrel protein [Thermoanaerobaculia bacterium]